MIKARQSVIAMPVKHHDQVMIRRYVDASAPPLHETFSTSALP